MVGVFYGVLEDRTRYVAYRLRTVFRIFRTFGRFNLPPARSAVLRGTRCVRRKQKSESKLCERSAVRVERFILRRVSRSKSNPRCVPSKSDGPDTDTDQGTTIFQRIASRVFTRGFVIGTPHARTYTAQKIYRIDADISLPSAQCAATDYMRLTYAISRHRHNKNTHSASITTRS